MSQSFLTRPANEPLSAFQAYQRQFVDYVRDLQETEALADALPPRIDVYAKLLYNKFDGSLRTCFPITHKLLGPGHWQHLVQDFIRDHRCQSPLYREIPDEFIDYLINDKPQVVLPEFIIDLAHFEWIELVLETAKSSHSNKIVPIEEDMLTITPALNPVLHLLHYRYPVQSITAEDQYWANWETKAEHYDEKPVILAGLSDKDYRIHFIELNIVTARLVELLQEGFRTGKSALFQLALEMRYSNPEDILPSGIDILRQLQSQQIIIGALHEQ